MKATIGSVELNKALKQMTPVIRKNTLIPITSSVMMNFEKNSVVISATDLESTVIISLECICQKPFTVISEYVDLLAICSKFASPITIEGLAKETKLECEGYKYKLPVTGEAEHFPKVPEDSFDFSIEADGDFFYSLKNANSCRSKEDMKVSMNAACISIGKNKTDIVGTDALLGYIMSIDTKSPQERECMVSDNFVQLVSNFQETTISVGEKFIKCECENITIISRLFEAKFCNYKMIVPRDAEYNISFNKDELKIALQRVGVAYNLSTNTCQFSFVDGGVIINSENVDLEKQAETAKIKVDHTVEIESIGVNGGQLLHLLNLISDNEVEMAFTLPTRTIYIKPKSDETLLCLLQPIFLN